jgi:hypothetical protein
MDSDVTKNVDQSGQYAQAPMTPGTHAQVKQHKTRRRKPVKLLVCILIALVVVGSGITCLAIRAHHTDNSKNINSNEFQALFLTNGQVYFGKLADLNDKYVTLTDIYYLQVQQSQTQQSVQPATAGSNQQVSLVKLGNELHGPEDKMSVAQTQVLFWENLKSSSKVVQAIDSYQRTH